MNESIKIKGTVHLICRDKDGNIKWEDTVNNGITNVGFAALAGLAGNTGSISAFTYLAVGTSTTAFNASQTTLVAEITDSGLARASASVSRTTTTQTNDTLTLTYSWTASGSKTVEEAGIFNASSSGIMLGRVLTGSKAVTSGDGLTVTYNVKFA